jgi:anti-sigma factor RsiW
MTNCESVRELLSAWLDGELKPSDAELVRHHVDQCPHCREKQRQLDRLQSMLANAITHTSAEITFEPFWRGVQQRIAERRSWNVGLYETLQSLFIGPKFAWAVPAVIALLLGMLSVDALTPLWRQESQRNNFASVESIEAYGRNVALFRENETKTTVIWLYQSQEGEDESPPESNQTNPSF